MGLQLTATNSFDSEFFALHPARPGGRDDSPSYGSTVTPIYRPDNCAPAYQLNWSVSLFGRIAFPPKECWIDALTVATEKDGVRILEVHEARPDVTQFFVSTRPNLCPSEIIRSLKGRWQYIIRDEFPTAFRRNYSIASVGDETSATLGEYVGKQLQRHPMVDDRVNNLLGSLQFHDVKVDLESPSLSGHGQFTYALHVVIENASGWNEIRDQILSNSREMIVRAAAAKMWRLSRIGLLSNHIHMLLGCNVTNSPESVALSLLNNLAYVQGMQPIFRFSYFVGTFGSYNRNAIRNRLDSDRGQ